MLYITSSRKPSLTTKRLCKSLSAILPRSIYENRGKKSVEDLILRAKALGKQRIMFIYEQKGNPFKISFIRFNKNWEWMQTELIIKGLKLTKIHGRLPNELQLSASEKLKELFYYEEPESDDFITLTENENRLKFTYNGRSLLEIKAEYYENKA